MSRHGDPATPVGFVNAHLADHSPILRRHRLHEHRARENGGVTRATVSTDGETITVHIPLTFRKRGGRKLVVTPDGAEWAPRILSPGDFSG